MPDLSNISSNFVLTWDIGILVFLFFVAFFYGLSMGRRRLTIFLASLYFGIVLAKPFPYFESFIANMPEFQKFAVELSIFLFVVVLMFYFLSGSVFRSSFRMLKKEESPWWHLILLSFATTGFFFASILAILPVSYYNNLSTITNEFFLFNNAHFWWAVAGISALAILRIKKKKE